MSAELQASRRDATLILTLSNPGAKNALHPDMYAAAMRNPVRTASGLWKLTTLKSGGVRGGSAIGAAGAVSSTGGSAVSRVGLPHLWQNNAPPTI